MKVLVTGGSGFIGTWIVKGLLEAGLGVRVFDLKEDRRIGHALMGVDFDAAEWHVGDVSDRESLTVAAEGCGQIVHLAALLTPACAEDPHRGLAVNVAGTINVFEAALAHGMRRVLYMSSASVYGPDDGLHPFPVTLYGVWKLAMEGVARCYAQSHGIASAGYRPLVVYGPGREVGISAGPTLAIAAAARGEAYTIPFSGSTDMLFVEDLVSAYVQAATRTLSGAKTYSIVGEVATMESWIDAIRHHIPHAELDCGGFVLPVTDTIDEGELRSDFPGVPRTSIATGVARTVEWYQARNA